MEQTEIVIDLQDIIDHGNDDLADAIETNAGRYVSAFLANENLLTTLHND